MSEKQQEPKVLNRLRQWESETGKPANASEANAFIDGFNAGFEERVVVIDRDITALRQRCERLEKVLSELSSVIQNYRQCHDAGCDCELCAADDAAEAALCKEES